MLPVSEKPMPITASDSTSKPQIRASPAFSRVGEMPCCEFSWMLAYLVWKPAMFSRMRRSNSSDLIPTSSDVAFSGSKCSEAS